MNALLFHTSKLSDPFESSICERESRFLPLLMQFKIADLSAAQERTVQRALFELGISVILGLLSDLRLFRPNSILFLK